jgi:hypothetical protein
MSMPGQQVFPLHRGLSFLFVFEEVVACSSLRVSGLEEEVAASHFEADELHRWLNNLEDHHKALARAVLDVVRRSEGHLLPNRLHPYHTKSRT